MKTVVVFGASGMLGSMVVDVLSRAPHLRVIGTVRDQATRTRCEAKLPGVEWRLFDASGADMKSIEAAVAGANWVINAIGMTKPYTHDDNPEEIERAININSLLPYKIGHAARTQGARVLQIATDCVFSGIKGRYTEQDSHDALDVYGKTKSLGESLLENVHNIRCSIIGPEPKAYAFLLEWFVRQPAGASVNGFTNHLWNGVTTLQFARLCLGAIQTDLKLGHLQHIVPEGTITKCDLLKSFAACFARGDIVVNPSIASKVIDRTLGTVNPDGNTAIWVSAGYARPPTVQEMVKELSDFNYRMKDL